MTALNCFVYFSFQDLAVSACYLSALGCRGRLTCNVAGMCCSSETACVGQRA